MQPFEAKLMFLPKHEPQPLPLGSEPAQFPPLGQLRQPQKNWEIFMSVSPAAQEVGQVLGQVSTHLGSLLETSLGYSLQNMFFEQQNLFFNPNLRRPNTYNGWKRKSY